MKPRLRAESPTVEPAFDLDEAMLRVEATIQAAIACDEPLLARMVEDVVGAGGKRLRPRIALLAFQACGGYNPERVVAAGAAFELIHTASLVHDDIIDQSPLRRGRPTIHTAYGIPHALVAGDFLFTKGFALSGKLPKEVIDVTAEACVRLAEGEVMEQRLVAEDVDEAHYIKIIVKKTAEPIRACAKTGALLADAPADVVEALAQYGLDVGIAFQIADDVLDIAGDPEETGKVVGQDARTGVVTLPAGLMGLDKVAASFRKMARESDPDELRAMLEEAGAIDAARDKALEYARRAQARLDVLPDSPAKAALFAIAQMVVERKA